MSFIKDALTEKNGKAWDLKRISAVTFIIGFHANELYDVFWRHAPFFMKDYAVAAGMMIASLGAALALANSSEAAEIPPGAK